MMVLVLLGLEIVIIVYLGGGLLRFLFLCLLIKFKVNLFEMILLIQEVFE